MPKTYFFGIANIKGQDPPREVTPAGVLRIIQYEDGTSQADYFKGAIMGSFEFDNLIPAVSAVFDEGEAPLKIANKMLDVLPGTELSI